MDTLQFFPILVMGFVTSLGLTPVARQLALRLGVVAVPNNRNIHAGHKPLMGGLAIYCGFTLALVLFSPPLYMRQFGALSALAFVLSMIADFFALPAALWILLRAKPDHLARA